MEKTISFQKVSCFYRIEGRGPCVMLVHGFVEEGSMWDAAVKQQKKSYQLIIPDLPGFGKSQLVPQSIQVSMELYADYLYAILKQEKVKKAIMLGHSMGGYITLHFAEKYGGMLKGFGLINSHCFEDTEEKKANRKKGIEFVRRNGTAPFVKELYNSIFHESYKKKNQKLIDGLIARANKYLSKAVIRANEAMMNRKDKSKVLKEAIVPVLMINGKNDESAPLAYSLKQAPFPNIADVHFFDNCKHMCIFEKQKETLEIIENFCKRL
jgi:pimeloyl-ACP methyl ester carboxylesterase